MAIQTYIGCPLASFMVALEAKERSLQGPVRRVATCVFGRDTEFSWNFGNPMMRTKLQNGNNLSILAGRLIFVGVSGFLALLQAVQRTCKRVGDFFFWGKATKDGFPTPQKSHGFSFPPPPYSMPVNHCVDHSAIFCQSLLKCFFQIHPQSHHAPFLK